MRRALWFIVRGAKKQTKAGMSNMIAPWYDEYFTALAFDESVSTNILVSEYNEAA